MRRIALAAALLLQGPALTHHPGLTNAEQFITIAVENVRPFAVAVYPASGAMIAAGQRRIEAAMALLAQCWETGVWPGYGDLVQEPIELPGWCRD